MTENVMKLAVRNNKKSNVKTYPSRTWMKNKMNDPYLFDEENVEEVFSIKPLKPSFFNENTIFDQIYSGLELQ